MRTEVWGSPTFREDAEGARGEEETSVEPQTEIGCLIAQCPESSYLPSRPTCSSLLSLSSYLSSMYYKL